MIISGIPALRYWFKVIRFKPNSATVSAMGNALLQALIEIGDIKSKCPALATAEDASGEITVFLKCGTFYENSLFCHCLEEILSSIVNPRYIISRTCIRGKAIDFHNVPSVFGCKKENALLFHKWWSFYLGKSKMLFTRCDDGRLIILKTRAHSIANKMLPSHEIRNRWM